MMNTRHFSVVPYWLLFCCIVYWTMLGVAAEQTPSSGTENSFGRDLNAGVAPRINQPGESHSTRVLLLNDPVQDEIQPREQHVYRAHYTSGTDGGSVKLRARLMSRLPPSGERLTVSVQNSASAYLFTLPMVMDSHRASHRNRGKKLQAETLMSVSRILCPIVAASDFVFVTIDGPIAASARSSYRYQIELTLVNASAWFLVASGKMHFNQVTVSAPAVYQYSWPQYGVEAVRVMVETGEKGCNKDTDKATEVRTIQSGNLEQQLMENNGYNSTQTDEKACASLAIQDAVCPLTLTMDEVLSVAHSLTFTECGSIVITREIAPNGFYVTVLMHSDDSDRKCYPNSSPRTALFTNSTRVKPVRVSVIPYRSRFVYTLLPVALSLLFVIIGCISFSLKLDHMKGDIPEDPSGATHMVDNEISQYPMQTRRTDATGDRQERSESPYVSQSYTVSEVVSHSSVLLTCAITIIAIGANSIVMDILLEWHTGNLDVCYRNDLCSHHLGKLPDFNHVVSNLPYIGAGMGFLIAVFGQRKRYVEAGGGSSPNARYGVPHDFALFASLGVGLLLEGFTSGLYHVCPNNRNSLIDFFFIYYMYGALGAKLWQTRRGVLRRFHFTPALVVATITLMGSVEYVAGRTYAWWATVVVIHMFASAIWSAMMYFHGDVGLFRVWKLPQRMVDHRTRRVAVVHLVINFVLGITGLAAWPLFSNFSLYVLIFFTGNAGVYLVYYMVMKKIRHREHISAISFIYLLIGVLVTVPALVLFVFYNPYNTMLSPASSRAENAGCFNDGFFDAHDVWHFLSAAALFFVLMGIMTLDDDLLHVPRSQIPVF